MKEAIKKWRRLNHQKETDELLNLKNNVATLEKVAEYRTLSDNELMNRSRGFRRILELEKMKALDLKQKARIKWTTDGDENTMFFYGYISSRNRKNRITGWSINGRWT